MTRRFTALVPVAAAAIVVAGCGSSSSKKSDTGASTATTPSSTQTTGGTSSGGSAAQTSGNDLKLSADPSGQLKFNVSTLSAKSGKVTLTMDNPSPIPHGVSIEGNGVDKDGKVVNKGGMSTVSASLKPGKYTFYCPVPGHRQAGMQGTLTVK